MRFPRSSGILCHITGLPDFHSDAWGDYLPGIGDMGPEAYRFVDFLELSGQTIWQLLPLGPPAQGNSPYSCYSAFAGNPLLISPVMLHKAGWLDPSDFGALSGLSTNPSHVDYEAVTAWKLPLLRLAYQNFQARADDSARADLQAFCDQHESWLNDFARFETLMNHFGESDWTRWPAELVHRNESPLASMDAELADQIAFSKFVQFVFDTQWARLKQYAGVRNVRMYGDMPIFVAHQSADVWANQSLFALDETGSPALVAGVPPDYFSKTGQLWGNPQYRWDVSESTNHHWWTARFAQALRQFDLLRVDHFRGFQAYWEVPATARTAQHGTWRKGPGAKPFEAARQALGELPLVAEDLGMITEEVHQLREQLGFPGMRVLQFGFDRVDDDFHRPTTYPKDSVAYTGTHDNDTVMGWYRSRKIAAGQVDPLQQVLTSERDIHWQLVGSVMESASDTAIVPVQDLLGLGNEARINIPGKAKGNWAWRLDHDALTANVAQRLKALTQVTNRLNKT